MSQIDRRRVIAGGASALCAFSAPRAHAGPTSIDPSGWLGSTRLINKDHSRVQSVAKRLTQDASTHRDKALAIFKFVRDDVKFGFARGFWDNKASDVLASKIGFCNTKSTLFIALLRAVGIPARQVFVELSVDVLFGIISPGTPYVDHSFTEVFIDGHWVSVDAYIVDAGLFKPAQSKARAEDHLMAYGVHSTGTMHWDGTTAAFAQYNILDARPIARKTWGVFADTADFYRRADRTWNRLNPIIRGGFSAFASGANRRANALRSETT